MEPSQRSTTQNNDGPVGFSDVDISVSALSGVEAGNTARVHAGAGEHNASAQEDPAAAGAAGASSMRTDLRISAEVDFEPSAAAAQPALLSAEQSRASSSRALAGMDMPSDTVAAAVACLQVLCNLENGVGAQLGRIAVEGIPGIEAFLLGALVWGWAGQERKLAASAQTIAAAAGAVPAVAAPGEEGGFAAGNSALAASAFVGGASGGAAAAVAAAAVSTSSTTGLAALRGPAPQPERWLLARQPLYLQLAGESGLESAVRRLRAAQATAASRGVNGGGASTLFQHCSSLLSQMQQLKEAVLSQLQQAQGSSTDVTVHSSFQNPLWMQQPGRPALSAQQVVAQMHSPAGLLLPLIVNHNFSPKQQEWMLIASAIRAFLADREQEERLQQQQSLQLPQHTGSS